MEAGIRGEGERVFMTGKRRYRDVCVTVMGLRVVIFF